MAIRFRCPHADCGAALRAPDGAEGQSTRCVACGREVVVPAGEAGGAVGREASRGASSAAASGPAEVELPPFLEEALEGSRSGGRGREGSRDTAGAGAGVLPIGEDDPGLVPLDPSDGLLYVAELPDVAGGSAADRGGEAAAPSGPGARGPEDRAGAALPVLGPGVRKTGVLPRGSYAIASREEQPAERRIPWWSRMLRSPVFVVVVMAVLVVIVVAVFRPFRF